MTTSQSTKSNLKQTNMMKRILLLLTFCKVNLSAFYKEQQHVPKGKIIYTGEEPSKLACIQKSFYYKAVAVYDGRFCTCIETTNGGDDGTVENEIKGSAYSLVGDLPTDKYKIPESCQEIADREPLATSGLYTIRYSASKTIQVYCDMDRNLKVLTETGQKPIEAGWMLIANLSFSTTISKSESIEITGEISSNIDEMKDAATKNFLLDSRLLIKFPIDFKRIRFYCKRDRTIHFLGLQDVTDYFVAKTDTCPSSCNKTFERFEDDNSNLAGKCEDWKRQKWGCERYGIDRLYYWPFYIPYGDTYTLSWDRIECDDRKNLRAGTWQIFVK